MKYPEGTTHFGFSPDKRLIWYKSTNTKVWHYITDDNFKRGAVLWNQCINKPTILLMQIKDY